MNFLIVEMIIQDKLYNKFVQHLWNRVELTFNADTTGAFNDDNGESLQLNI